jgi:hypothetical protein
LGTHRAFAAADGKVEIARNQRTDDARAAATNDDNFDIDAVFSKQSLVFSYQILPLVVLTELNPTRSLSCAASGVASSSATIRLVVEITAVINKACINYLEVFCEKCALQRQHN